jgi:hypothetical protein
LVATPAASSVEAPVVRAGIAGRVLLVGRGFTRRQLVVKVADDHVVDLGDTVVVRGHAVTGHVRDERGEPVANAHVVLGDQDGMTDAAGGFDLVGVGGIPGEPDWGSCRRPQFFATDPPARAVSRLGVDAPNLLVSIKMTAIVGCG